MTRDRLASTLPVALNAEVDPALWRPLRLFNVARIVVALVLVGYVLFTAEGRAVGQARPTWFFNTALGYLVAATIFAWAVRRLKTHYLAHVVVQAMVDIAAIVLLMHASGGIRSGFGTLMLMPIAGAAILARGRLALLFAAIAAIGLLAENSFWVLNYDIGFADYLQVAVISAGCFMAAWVMRHFAARLIANEGAIRRKELEVSTQLAINRLVVRDMEDGVIVVDEAGVVLLANPMAEKLVHTQDLAGRRLSEGVPHLHRALGEWRLGGVSVSAIASSRGSGVTISGPPRTPTPRAVELRFPSASALSESRVNARFVIATADAADGGEAYARETVIFLQDVRASESRAQQLKLASLGRLTASIAHEIRNPLSAIKHAGELLAEEAGGRTASEANQTQLKLTRIIGQNTVRLNRIVEEVLQLNRRDRRTPEPIQLATMLGELVTQLIETERLASNTIDLAIDAHAQVEFDPQHLHQVVWNLLTNALRYCDRSPGAVRLRVTDDPTLGVLLSVSDNGPGIAPEVMASVFEPFFTTHTQGSGLGLYIARDLCSANHASLDVLAQGEATTTDLPGATFRIRFA